jgi:glutathione synthase/RimK-type ligase-like ATP-grasp enzyme
MKLAIHNSPNGFHPLWTAYCEENNISYKLVDCHDTQIVAQLKDCSALMFHFHHFGSKDIVMAKPLLFALEQSGLTVFPNFNSGWHFDDKVGQKYLLEALNVDLVKTWVFYDAKSASNWLSETTFPKVFKLRGGAGSINVQLVYNKKKANQLVEKAFGKGFPAYDAWGSLNERFRKWRLGKADFKEVLKGIVRLVKPPHYAKVMGSEINYLYFQEFIPNNDSDTRIIVIDGKAFGIKRMNRENDFRASGSGTILYSQDVIDIVFVKAAFAIDKKLKAQCVAYDFVYDNNKKPLLIEISYGFANAGYDDCPGYWDEQLNWHEGKFNPYGWMVELVLNRFQEN